MTRPPASGLTDHELAIMHILWEQPGLSVADILKIFPRLPKPAYTSLLTAVRSMEKKGLVRHRQDGKAYLYFPVLEEHQYRQSALSRLIGTVFNNNAFDLAVNLIRGEKLDKAEVKKLKKILEDL